MELGTSVLFPDKPPFLRSFSLTIQGLPGQHRPNPHPTPESDSVGPDPASPSLTLGPLSQYLSSFYLSSLDLCDVVENSTSSQGYKEQIQ